MEKLFDSMEYSLFNGGKRFRPCLSFAAAEALDVSHEYVLGFALALECVHTYSLIHDDLPCMDDDDERRGLPTNHKKFPEEIALLAGDSLLTEAFYILATMYPERGAKLIEGLSNASGPMGMVRGQVLDLNHGSPVRELSQLIHLHELKTGQLISQALGGPAVIAGYKANHFGDLGLLIGLAFQVKDDLLDEEDDDEMSFLKFLGVQGTKDYLESLTEKIHLQLAQLNLRDSALDSMVRFNLERDL